MQNAPPAAGARPSLVQRIAQALLRWFGWRSVLVGPPAPKGIIVVYPHTSNWDFIIGILYKLSVGIPARWMGKDTLFRWPVRRLMIGLGGIPMAAAASNPATVRPWPAARHLERRTGSGQSHSACRPRPCLT